MKGQSLSPWILPVATRQKHVDPVTSVTQPDMCILRPFPLRIPAKYARNMFERDEMCEEDRVEQNETK
eukprot:1259204-Amorphochlora_amoeboformis.AAC.1